MRERLKQIASQIAAAARSQRGRDVMLYLLFCFVAFVFWVFLTLDNEVQRDFDIPFELTDIPDSVTVIVNPPSVISASVKGKDSQLLHYKWGGVSPMKVKWSDVSSDGAFFLSHERLDTRVREYFGQTVTVLAVRPDSIRLPYTTLPGVRVKLDIHAEVEPALQYIVSGPLTTSADSVMLYSTGDLPHSLRNVSTEPLIRTGLTDTTSFEVKIKPIAGVRIVPDRVRVTVPVEPLISRKRNIALTAINVPSDVHLVTFPSSVEISYLVAMSSYNTEMPVKAIVDYDDVRLPGNKLPVIIVGTPRLYHNLSFSPDSVEYIIESND